MDATPAEEYAKALKQGRRECAELAAAGLPTQPKVLDEILAGHTGEIVKDMGLVEIPANRIVGTKSAGRIAAFSPTFQPLLDTNSEFSIKWVRLCEAHLGETGITDPIECFEYLGNFYVQEGNKRVSVLRHFGAATIPANVKRILPPPSDSPRIKAYYEFLDFYKLTGLYQVQYREPTYYGKLLSALQRSPEEAWTEAERRTFKAYYQYFCEALTTVDLSGVDLLPEEAFILWLKVYPYAKLGEMSASALKSSVAALRDDLIADANKKNLKVTTKMEESTKAPSLIDRLIAPVRDALHVAFVHQMNPDNSSWTLNHDEGRQALEAAFGSRIAVRSYFDANNPAAAEAALEQAVAEGAQVVFATAPLLSPAVLKMAVKYPKVQFFNCAVDQPYSSVRSYYARIYEGKFITGAIAGALAQNDRIGYIASSPILGEPATINAFALGALLVNPRAQVEVKWTCLPGNPQQEFFEDGIRVISNRESPVNTKQYTGFCSFGTYLLDDTGNLIPLGSPVWVWSKFYETVIGNLLKGEKPEKPAATALNYWLGMDTGVINVSISKYVPTGVATLAGLLRRSLMNGSINPFFRKIVAQDGTVKNDGSTLFTPEELLHMDWLADNVIGSIPAYSEMLPMAQPMVRAMGLHRDQIPIESEAPRENFDRLR